MATPKEMTQLKDIINILQDNLGQVMNKSQIQREFCNQYISIFEKFSKSLTMLSSKITQHTTKLETQNNQSVILIFKNLSTILNKIALSARNVASKGKNQIVDPLKLFTDNCYNFDKSFLGKLKQKQSELNEKYSELFKNKESYISASEKHQKNRKMQGKLMVKIENGDLTQLQKFNNNIRKITENIKITEEYYMNSVNNLNKYMDTFRSELKDMAASLSYNEESRVSFTKKALIYSIKNLKQFSPDYSAEMDTKLDQQLQEIQKRSQQSMIQSNLNNKIIALATDTTKEQFLSYQQMLKIKRRKVLQQQNSHLIQIFSKVKAQDKNTMRIFVKNLLMVESSHKQKEVVKVTNQEWQACKLKVVSVLPYSYFFIELIYEQIIQLNSIYCKLSQQFFLFLLEFFSKIIQSMKFKEGSTSLNIQIQFLYRIIHISMRIMWKKNTTNSSQPIELLCQHLGKKSTFNQNQQMFYKLYVYLEKKKKNKKDPITLQSPKSMMSSFMKGMQEAMSIKKQVKLTDQQLFSCINEVTYMMANLLTPNQIAIPVIKRLLGKGQNSSSFQYLKSILFDKKDQHERQKIFFRTEIKGQMQEIIKNIIQKKKIAQYCIKLTARKGFFGKSQINLRLVCQDMRNIHQDILYRIEMSPEQKWIHLIPYNKKMTYSQVKKQVQERKLTPTIEQIIVLDVNRSLHNHTQVLSQQLLRCLLRTYAVYHTQIGYCQGMNYIAGYLYLKSKNEQTAYRLFEYLMQRRFKELFANEFEVLKVKLYQFERLLSIFHPEISDHFKRQGITSECYIVSWIITVFASSYQYTQESYFIDLLWERFIIWGWREFFRFVLALFSIYKDKIIELTYDKAMHLLGSISKSEMLKLNKQQYKAKYGAKHLQQLIDQFQISSELIEKLEKQYALR